MRVASSDRVALSRRREQGGTSTILAKVVRRSLIIFGLGIALNGFPSYHWETIRIPGVLQRIGIEADNFASSTGTLRGLEMAG